ncbi:N-acetylmuramoyl-L-alanine amidase [Lysobacter capsici AZ78]|uniref:N-acetylmuramoyl-L-alanine amidase n=1 Tax=Lysobacter capsici AZ78 TaxID=1444315 RepID=A0A108U736_9GAMM|nr:N-acetylmuramoyl-L-alanine amidase [Lysobacter capsici]KWS03763.1 N-acetylmuramoyl-L-alanine amidase [Lysobacter capsici AZ78]
MSIKRSTAPIKFLTIHCAATPEGRANTAAEVTQWDTDRFGQPSYHLVIELSGRLVRTLDDDQIGVHVAKSNTGNIGVCYVGGMSKDMKVPKDTRTLRQKATLRDVVIAYKRKYPGLIVRGHNEWPGVAKACPSFDVNGWLKMEQL